MQIETQRTLPVPAGTDALLGNLIHERTGIYFEADRLDVLIEKLAPLAIERECRSMFDFYYLLKYEKNGTEDWERVTDALSVQETYFWREFGQVETLVDTIVPAWFAKTSMPLRIWSAASATGEEPYSIVMALLEAGWGSHPIEVFGSDSSAAAIVKARAGVFREKSFRSLPPQLRDKYFTKLSNEWRLRPEVVRRVTFHRANLLAPDEISTLASSPIIFCRNVFIYFSMHAIRQTAAFFASRMPPGGKLFVGASESLMRVTTEFELREINASFVYVRI